MMTQRPVQDFGTMGHVVAVASWTWLEDESSWAVTRETQNLELKSRVIFLHLRLRLG